MHVGLFFFTSSELLGLTLNSSALFDLSDLFPAFLLPFEPCFFDCLLSELELHGKKRESQELLLETELGHVLELRQRWRELLDWGEEGGLPLAFGCAMFVL